MHGLAVFKLYDNLKKVYPDLDTWEAESYGDTFSNIENAKDILPVVVLCETTRLPWEDLLVFQKVCLIINERDVFFDIKQDLSINEIAYAVSILKQRYPDELFNDSVSEYIATEAIDEGFVVLPHVIHFAQRFIPNYYINKDQEELQRIHLQEAENYKTLMNEVTINV